VGLTEAARLDKLLKVRDSSPDKDKAKVSEALRAGNVGFRVYKTQKQATDALASARVAREAQTAQSILTTTGNWGKRMAAWPIESEGFLKLLS
jgi:hypothetical protein